MWIRHVIGAVLLALGLPLGAEGLRAPLSGLPGCGCDERSELTGLHERIVSARSLAEARTLALAPALEARRALGRARWLAPRSRSLREAEARLAAYGSGIRAAESRAEVGDRFAELVRLAPASARAAASGTERPILREPAACTFTTLEIVAIVLGFLLGIIPGIILLLILC